MYKCKIILLIFIGLTTHLSVAQYTDVINSNRPGESMSAFSVGQTVFQTELGMYGINEKHELLTSKATGIGSDFSMRYGFLMDELEIVTNIQFQTDRYSDLYDTINRTGFRKFLLGAKYLIYDPNKLLEGKDEIRSWKKLNSFSFKDMIPAVSVYAGTNINIPKSPFNNFLEPTLAPKVMLITQNQFPRSFVLIMNFFADRFLGEYLNYGYVVTLTKGFNPYWSAFLEHKGVQGDYYSDGVFTGGAAHLFGRNLQMDISISKNYKTTPSFLYGGIGFSWRFDDNFKETWVRDTKLDREAEKRQKIEDKKQKKIDDAQYKLDKAQYKIDKAAYDKEMKAEKEAKKNKSKPSKEKASKEAKTKDKKTKDTKSTDTKKKK